MHDIDYQQVEFEYRRPPELDAGRPAHRPVVVVGAGPVGLSMAIDLQRQGLPVLLLDDDYRLSTGSRAICFAKRTLDIWDRLGVGQRMMDKGVSWNVGRVFFRDEEIWQFDLLPEPGHRRPAFINLQQYYVEGYLQEHAAQQSDIELRWRNKVVAVEQDESRVTLTVETPDGTYQLTTDYLIACDGARSPIRHMLGQESRGVTFRDRFLIADIKMKADFPSERWFWFDPPFHPNQSVLLHRQPDNVWRVDFQLGWDADPVEEVKPERVLPRLRAVFGDEAEFTLEWVSIYTFSCQRMEKFRHGRIFFAGDAAHRVSPFGARGANSGVQDIENLAWKLALVMRGHAPEPLLDTYGEEREYAADENLLNSTRSTDFITPKSEISKLFRNTVLKLAKKHPFARSLVNSGRLSVPATLHHSSLNTADMDDFTGAMVPGAVALDAPVALLSNFDGTEDQEPDSRQQDAWFLGYLGHAFTLVLFDPQGDLPLHRLHSPEGVQLRVVIVHSPEQAAALNNATGHGGVMDTRATPATGVTARDAAHGMSVTHLVDTAHLLQKRYDAEPGTAYLIRPDQHVTARWRQYDPARIHDALSRAIGAPISA